MTRALLLLALPLGVAACNVERDAGNDTTSFTVNEQKVDRTLDKAGDAIGNVASDVKDAAEDAGPVLRNAADDVGEAAKKAGDKVENSADRAAADVREETRDNRRQTNDYTFIGADGVANTADDSAAPYLDTTYLNQDPFWGYRPIQWVNPYLLAQTFDEHPEWFRLGTGTNQTGVQAETARINGSERISERVTAGFAVAVGEEIEVERARAPARTGAIPVMRLLDRL